ncbi:hypothetical protein [Flavobacterium sp.]
MKKIHSILCLLFIVITFSACNPDDSNPSGNDDTFAENFGSTVSKDFIGQVVDTNNEPIQGVTIKIGTTTAQTDVNGIFIINGANVYQKFAYITAKKAGYIDGSRALVPTSGKNSVKIMLLPSAPIDVIQSGVESEVALPSGTKVIFDGAFEDENGNNYTGSVSVTMFHLLPSNENISRLMPGMLYAQTANNQQAALETYGMLNVELRGSAGQKLNIKNGHTAEISLKIDASQTSSAPSTIPLWHFDEAKGYWKEDGIATKVGDKYVGNVSHFSWWNCDAPFQTVSLTVTIVDANGNPLSNVAVGLLANGNTYPVMGYTNNEGVVSGLIPANQTLTLNVYPDFYTCASSNSIYTTAIGPFTSNTVLPDITISNSSTILSSRVVGTLLKCDNSNVTNGYVILNRSGGQSVSPIVNGAFSFNELYCPSDTNFTLLGVDFDNLQQTDSLRYNFTNPITNVGNLQACTAVNEFISYTVDNNPTVYITQQVSAGFENPNGTPVLFYIYGNSNQNSVSIWGNASLPGIYTTAEFSIEGGGIGYIGATTNNNIQFNLNAVGSVGGYIDMTFSGEYTIGGVTHTITGVAHAIRDN